MRWLCISLGVVLLGSVLCSCGPSAPSTMEILEALEVEVNEQDLEGVMALFAEDALWDASYKNEICEGFENIEWCWEIYFMTPVTSEFRDISVDGDTATFTWVEFTSAMNRYWPTIVEVQNGKITLIEWPEDATRESIEFE
jgi:ketosteroid isomerase-like protein